VGTNLAAPEKILGRAWPEMPFLAILQYKMRGRPAKPGPDPKIETRGVQWDGHKQDFLSPKEQRIFSTRPEKCLNLLTSKQ
jgi:hypothetical protein